VKIAYPKKAGGRGQMRERHRRDRTLAQPLRVKYPQVTSLRLEFKFSDSGPFAPTQQVNVMHPPAQAFFCFPCPYEDCDGEFDLSTAIDGLVKDGDASCNGELGCSGQRSGSKEKFGCTLKLSYTIDALRE
jgi:hypothetical protein